MTRRFRIPIWLTTLIVSVMILLFSLIIYDAREKEMVEQYNRQQMAIAKGIASGIEDLIAGIERSIKTLTTWRGGSRYFASTTDLQDLKFFYRALEGKVEFVARSDGRSISAYPTHFENRMDQNLDFLIREVRRTGETYVGHLINPYSGDQAGRTDQSGFIIIATPELDSSNNVSGILFAAVSLSNIVQRYIETAKYDFSCDAWVLDDRGTILYHPDKNKIGQDASILERLTSSPVTLRELMLKLSAGYGVFRLTDNGQIKRKIVAYAPIRLNIPQWSIAVSTPYHVAIAHLKMTYYMIMVGAFFLIIAAIVGSFFMVRAGKKRIRLEEELKHLRDKDALQEKLAREKRMVDGIIEGSPIPMFVIDRGHRIISWNKACAGLTGYAGGDMIGTDRQYLPFYPEKRPVIADLIVDRDIAALDHYYGTKRVQGSAVIQGAYEASDFYENLGGKSRHLYFLAAPIYNESGEIIAAIETLQDVSREKQMELDLKEYAESLKNELDVNINLRKGIEELYIFLESIIKSSPDKIYALDSKGIINYVSRGVAGPDSQGRMKGIHLTDLVEPQNRTFVLEKWEEGKKGIFKPYEMIATARDGSKRNLLISVTPIKGTDKFIIVQRDITEFKNLEKKFYESQRLAAIGQLSAGIAHEVRNPLSSIKMSLQILQRRLNPGGNDLKRFKIAEKEVEHLEKLVSDILIFARPDELDLRVADINSFIEHSLEMAEKEISDKSINVKLELQPGLPHVPFDAPKLGQALLNLYLNAIDAMEPGGMLKVSTRTVENEHKNTVEIHVEDNGCGISERDLPYLFNPFFTKKSSGTGLGLAQVKKIIDLHQGSIDFISKTGEGTRVVLTLPIAG